MCLAVLVLFGVWPVSGVDLLMHVFLGRYTWEHRDVPRIDLFSYVSADNEFIAHSWLSELLFYGLEQSIGVAGFALLRLVLVGGALWCVLRTARLLGASWQAIILIAPLALLILWGRVEVRPQIFSTAFLALQLWLVVAVHVGARSHRWLWVLPPLYALWINLHPGWPQGLAMLVGVAGVVGTIQARQRWLSSGGVSNIPLRQLMLVLLACLLVLPLNPYDLRLTYFPLEMQQAWIRAGSPEFQSPLFNRNWRLVGGGMYVAWIQRAFFGYLLAVVVALLASLRRWRTVDVLPVAIMGFWCLLAIWHQRASTDMALLTSPLLAAAWPAWWARRPWSSWAGIAGVVVVIAVVVRVMLPFSAQEWSWPKDEPGCAAAAIERLGLSGRVLSANGRGSALDSWLLYRFWPKVWVNRHWEYVQQETAFYGLRTAEEVGGIAGLQGFLDQHQVNWLTLHTYLAGYIADFVARGWKIIHTDNRYFILLRETPETADLIQREAYRHLLKLEAALEVVTEANASEVLTEADQALRHCPDGASFAHAYKTRALRLLGRHVEADEAARQIPRDLRIPM